MANSFFRFKEFVVNQQHAAMKVGTDGVLLGAWCRIDASHRRILDIGTGTGLIALMAAQRSQNFEPQPLIDALEIDESSHRQAIENFDSSSWSDRLTAIHSSLQDFVRVRLYTVKSAVAACEDACLYDNIISNPPYFNNSLTCPDNSRTNARHTLGLTYTELAEGIDSLLAAAGIASLIIPCAESELLIDAFAVRGLYPSKRTEVCPTSVKPPKRTLIEFSRDKHGADPKQNSLIVETDVRHIYTDDYMALTSAFYLDRLE